MTERFIIPIGSLPIRGRIASPALTRAGIWIEVVDSSEAHLLRDSASPFRDRLGSTIAIAFRTNLGSLRFRFVDGTGEARWADGASIDARELAGSFVVYFYPSEAIQAATAIELTAFED